MNIMKRLFWLLPVLLTMLVTGCLKEDLNQGTIVLMGTESEVQPIDSVIPDTLLNFIKDKESMGGENLVLNLSEGNMPPDIQGEFVFKPVEVYVDNGHSGIPVDSICFRFGGDPSFIIDTVDVTCYPGDTIFNVTDTIIVTDTTVVHVPDTVVYYLEGQHNMFVPCDIYGDVMEKGDKYNKKATHAFVMGAGKAFTAYFTVEYDCEYGTTEFKQTRGYILSGVIADEGIEEAKLAIVNKTVDVGGSPGLASLPEEGWIFVYRVRTDNPEQPFGTAVRQNWYN